MSDYCNHDHDNEGSSGHAFINVGGKNQAQSREVRIVKNDPSYERIDGLRQAREHRYLAKIYLIIGIVTLPLLGLGFIFLIITLSHTLEASKLEYRFRE